MIQESIVTLEEKGKSWEDMPFHKWRQRKVVQECAEGIMSEGAVLKTAAKGR
jgi:hypothetical protein